MWYTNCGSAAKALIAAAGTKAVANLDRQDVIAAAANWGQKAADTKYKRSQYLRRILTWLVVRHGAPEAITKDVPRAMVPPPRAVTATSDERRKLLAAARPGLRCYILLCSDLALRSGTAATICPNHYDAQARTISFSTKYNAKLTLPVTAELAQIFALATGPADVPYVAQLGVATRRVKGKSLSGELSRLRRAIGVTHRLTSHDLRRTTAVKVYEHTHDLRTVQAVLGHKNLQTTLIYLDHRNTPVNLDLLEIAKLNPITEVVQ